MNEPRPVGAYVHGQWVQVPVKPGPLDHRRVSCPSCGAAVMEECRDLVERRPLWAGHASRIAKAARGG